MVTYYLWRSIVIKGEVEDTRPRGQGQGHKKISRPRPRTDPLEAKAKDTGASVLQKKGLQKFFFRRSSLEENKKRSSQSFREVSGVFQQNFNGSTNSAVLEPKTAIFEDLRLRSQGQGLQNLSSRPRTSSRTPPLIVILIH